MRSYRNPREIQPPSFSIAADGSRTLLTYKQVAAILQLCEKTIFNKVKAGELKAVRLGGTVRIDSSDLAAFIEQGKERREDENGD